ncbi:MAG: PepSY domain-containing protein [Dehalococcoidia bacterium]|nr:PepSY domain-containing protein [Dehalococcoidia bacterium]
MKDNVVEVEGRDANNREVKLLVDRRSGEILSRRLDD